MISNSDKHKCARITDYHPPLEFATCWSVLPYPACSAVGEYDASSGNVAGEASEPA